MANEIQTAAQSGKTLYCLLRNKQVQVWNTGSLAFETYASGNYSLYAIALSEQGSTGFYAGSFPVQITTAGTYGVDVREQAGVSPAVADSALAGGSIAWNGAAEVFVTGDGSGRVSVGAYAGGQDPASLVLATAANKLATNASGQVQADMTQAVPTTNTQQTVGDALNAARAQGFGKWTLVGAVLTLYAPDGSTAVRTFTLDNALNPTVRA